MIQEMAAEIQESMTNPVELIFKAENPTDNFWESFVWWEIRRIPYNLIVGLTGLACTITFLYAGSVYLEPTLPPGEDFVEPIALFGGILLFGLGANVCYTFGWIVESQMKQIDLGARRAFRERNFKLGLLFSTLLACAPLGLALLYWLGSKVK
jgi:hypothetical protein